jgi:uncharacterized protein YutE (UPF0331/DUF86 family)
MVIKQNIIIERLKELDTIIEELSKYRQKRMEDVEKDLSLRWIIERGLIAAATMIFEIVDHILSSTLAVYSETYEDSLRFSMEKGIISEKFYKEIKGLGGFRNILVHEYLDIDLNELWKSYQKAFEIFPQFSLEIQEWIKKHT